MDIKKLTPNSALNTLSQSVARGQADLNVAAQKIAGGSGQSAGDQSFNQALVEARYAATQIEASAKALKRLDDVLGQFIDTRA